MTFSYLDRRVTTSDTFNTPKMAENGRKFTVENFGTTYLDQKLNKLAKLRRHASGIHFALIHFG